MPLHVLLIESDPDRARALGEAIAAVLGEWTLEVAASLALARERLAVAEFDVALIGHSLSEGSAVDGVDLVQVLPTLLCVKPEEEWVAARALRQGFSDYMVWSGSQSDAAELADRMIAALDQWQSQRRLRETAQRDALVLAGSDLAQWDRHLPSGQVYLSERYCKLLGYGPGELGSDTGFWQRLMHPDDWTATHGASEAHLAGAAPTYHREYRMRHKDGHWVWVLSRGRVMECDAHGAPVRILGTLADITERRRDQDAAACQNRMLQAISRAQALVIASSDATTIYEALLAELLALTQSAYGFVAEVFFTPEHPPHVEVFAICDTVRGQYARRFEADGMTRAMSLSTPDTLFGAALVTGKPVFTNHPSTLGIPIFHGDELLALVGLADKAEGYSQADVDFLNPLCKTIAQLVQARRVDAARQRAQDQLEVTASQLAEKTQLLETTLDSINQGIVMVDSAERITVYNRCALELLALPDSLLATQPHHNDVVQFQATRGDFGDNYGAVEEAGRAYVARGELADGPARYMRKTPAGRMLEVTSRLLPSGYTVRTYSDITEQQLANDKLRESEARFRGLTALSSDWYWQQDEHYRFVNFEGNLAHADSPLEKGLVGEARWEIPTFNMTELQWQAHRAILDARQVFRDLELERRTATGAVFWMSISGEPIFDANGAFRGYRGVGHDITERKRAEAQIEQLAYFDPLTDLPNRQMLRERLGTAVEASVRHRSHGGLLFIDLDNFKTLNDTMGHDRGDLLLQQVALRLTQSVRAMDTVSRLGGDEFVVMIEELSNHAAEAATQVKGVAEKILAAINLPFDLAGQQHHTSPSIGATLFFDHMETVDELLKRADLAMYQAKAAGRNTIRFYDPQMQAMVMARAALEVDLRQGLTQGELQLHYQPVVDAAGCATGVEALVRWQHPGRGMVSPADFIPMAEQTGLILPLGRWVLATACAQLVVWSASPATQQLTMAVNVSAREFHQPDFAALVLATLHRTGANPQLLKLELTESLLLSDVEDAIAKMSELRSVGVGFALDDFGTGYSSLSYLKRLPLDQLKIDQSFVRDVLTDTNDAAIVRSILSLAQSLDLCVVAEGVETQGQRDFLERSGCKAFQGYLFGRPVPVGELRLT